MTQRQGITWPCCLIAVCLATCGCRASRQIHDHDYAQVVRSAQRAAASPQPTVEALPPVGPDLAGRHPVEQYIAVALDQNPEIQAARKRVDAMAYRVPQAASLRDPTFAVTLFPEPVQTAAGQQEASLMASQHLPWFGKLRTRAEVAEADANVARARLATVELEVVEQVKQSYYELYFIERAIGITQQDRLLLVDFTQIAESKYRTGTASQQDMLRAQVEVSNIDNQLIRLRQQLSSAQAQLARLLHLSPDTSVRPLEQLPGETIPGDLEALYERAIAARPDLHAQLAAVRRDRRSVELARLEYFPDLTAGVTWIDTSRAGISPVANGDDAVLLGLSVNVPLYRNRLDAGVREAEAQAVSSARQYDALRDRTTEDIKDLFVQATSQFELVGLFRDDIIPKAEQTLEVSRSAYQVGQVDFLQLLDNWQQLLRFQIAYYRLETQLRQTLATLERVVGGPLALERAFAAAVGLQVNQHVPPPTALPMVPPDEPFSPQGIIPQDPVPGTP